MHRMLAFIAETVPEGRVFALDTQTLINIAIQLLNGIILAVALSLILYKPVKRFMQNRTENIQKQINDSDATMAKANELIAEYTSKIKNVDKERLRVIEAARVEANEEKAIILEEARKEAERIKKRSLERIEAERKRSRIETRVYIVELATLLAEKYIAHSIDEKEQDKLFNEALAQLEETQWRK